MEKTQPPVKNNAEYFFNDYLKPIHDKFDITKNLSHPSILKYKYFVETYDPQKRTKKLHMLVELLEGGNLEINQ